MFKLLKTVGFALALSVGAMSAHAATWTETGGCSVDALTPNAQDCFGFADGNIQSHFDPNDDEFIETDMSSHLGLFEYRDWEEIQRDGDYNGGTSGTLNIVENNYDMVAVLLKGSAEWAAYLFEDGFSGALNFMTNNDRGLSNYLVVGRGMSDVPLPAGGLLLLAGLGGLGLMRRKRS